MFKVNDQKLITDLDGDLVAAFADSFVTSLGVEMQSDTVIFRLYQKDQNTPGRILERNQVHQFAMSAPRAIALAQALLECAAFVEKEKTQPPSQ